jgi:hypothetical protein
MSEKARAVRDFSRSKGKSISNINPMAQILYQSAQNVWHISPYYKSWEMSSLQTKYRFHLLAVELLERGIIQGADID